MGGILSYPELEKGNSNGALSNGNLTLTGVQSDGNFESALSNFASGSSGKYYAEVKINGFNTTSALSYGVIGASKTFDYNAVVGSQDAYAVTGTGSILNQGSNVGGSGINGINPNDVIGILLNLDDNQISFSYNGTVGSAFSIPADALGYKFAISVEGINDILTVNFGETTFSSLPTGYQGITQSSPYVEVEQDGLEFVGVSTFADDVTVSGALNVTGISTLGRLDVNGALNVASVADKTTIVDGNDVTLSYNTGGGNVAICTNPSGPITLNVVGIPTTSDFDNRTVSFGVVVQQGTTSYGCSSVNLNGVSFDSTYTVGTGTHIAYPGGVVSVGNTSSYDLFNFTCINTVGSASTAENYKILSNLDGDYRLWS